MRRGDLFVLSWESLLRVEWGKVSSFSSMSIQLPNRCWPLRGWKTRLTEEDGQIGTNHSLPLERGALFTP